MKARAEALILAGLLLGGCRATRDVTVTSYHVARGAAVGSYRVTRAVAVGSYHVVTAPAHLIHGHDAESQQTTTTATTADVARPGYQVPSTTEVSSQPAQPRQQPPQQRPLSNPAPAATPGERAAPKPKAPQTAAGQPQFPTGKPVPGHAGLVYNPFDPNGGFIDVSGYPPGTKVKDPDSQKIFIVP